MRIAVVSGASSGLGREFVLQLDQRATVDQLDEIWLIARREERLEELSRRLRTKARCLPLDLLQDASYGILAEQLKEAKAEIHWCVLSAGVGKQGAFSDLSDAELKAMIDLNCKALTWITHLLSPYFTEGSKLILISSSAAFLPQPHFAVYAATKAYVLSFARALTFEWKERRIVVLVTCPGPMETEFTEIAGQSSDSRSGKIKALGMERTDQVASYAIKSCLKRREIALHSPAAHGIRFISRVLPHPLILRIESLLGMFR